MNDYLCGACGAPIDHPHADCDACGYTRSPAPETDDARDAFEARADRPDALRDAVGPALVGLAVGGVVALLLNLPLPA